MRQQYNDEQAGILAANLKEGVPCPVCGAVHHPAPAKKSPNAPTKEEVEATDTKAKKPKKRKTNAAAAAPILTDALKTKKRLSIKNWKIWVSTEISKAQCWF